MFEKIDLQDYLDKINLDKVIQLYFYYKSIGNIKQMA